jgi:hypothetical protein
MLAALGQVFYLAHWPLYVLDTWIPRPAAVGVALVRLGIYLGLAWGILHRERTAWAGTVLELARTFASFILLAFLQDRLLSGDLYPAKWLQGLLCGALPAVWLMNGLLAGGWRPRTAVDVASFIRVLAATAGIGSLGLRRAHGEFGVPADRTWPALARGLPVVLVLSVVEGLALFLARSAGGTAP